MPVSLVMTFIGRDRPGLVNAIASRVAAHGAAWLESRLARLAEHFAGIVRVAAPPEKIEALTAALRELEREGLRVTIEAGASTEPEKRAGVKLELLCLDRPGIVREVTETIWSLGVNIEEFESNIIDAAFTGEPMFKATARLYAPATLGLDELRRRLERLAGEMMADISLSDARSSVAAVPHPSLSRSTSAAAVSRPAATRSPTAATEANGAMKRQRHRRSRLRDLADEIIARDVIARIEAKEVQLHAQKLFVAVRGERLYRLVLAADALFLG